MTAQRTPEWYAMRCGKVTASRIGDMLAKTKSGWGAGRANYAAQLIAERLTGIVAESYTNAAMEWGIVTEPEARAAYAFYADAPVVEVDFVPHPKITLAGASPDGLVGDSGLVEIKAPNTAGHIETLLGSSIAQKYVYQMQFQMACTGREWCDFVSFDPRMPERMRLHVQRLARDNAMIEYIESETVAFLAEIDAQVRALEQKFAKAA